MKRTLIGPLAIAAVVGGLLIGMAVATAVGPSPSQSAAPSTGETADPSIDASTTPIPSPSPTAAPTPTPSPTAVPTASPVPAPLTGRLVPPAVAAQRPIAVMVDDLGAARPQSGFNSASVVWQAPAEGGIPRYMMIFQETIPKTVGPVRSARYYYIAWAAEWRALYAHAGGSPQALQTLREKGSGQLVFNADQFRWGRSFWRVEDRFAPHNLYTSGKNLRGIARSVKATDKPMKAAWRFGSDLQKEDRPRGGRIDVAYSSNRIRYDYDWKSNTYLRSVTGEKKQIDAATGKRVAPKNVVIMLMRFGPLNDGSRKNRLEAQVIGSGTAWISTNGTTIKGKWKKASLTKPTQFFDAKGKPVTLTVGQTFVQVMQAGTKVTIKAGKPPPPPDPFSPGLNPR